MGFISVIFCNLALSKNIVFHKNQRFIQIMAAGKWIGSVLGFIFLGGPIGALAGFILGSLFDATTDGSDAYGSGESGYEEPSYNAQQTRRDEFLFSMMALASYIIRADGRIMHSEMETVRRFLRQTFGPVAEKEGESILLRLFEQQKRMGAQQFRSTIIMCCKQLNRQLNQSQRLQLLNLLVIIAQADGHVADEEMMALRDVTSALGLSAQDLNSMLFLKEDNLDAAYKVLGIDPSASNDEVKAAYRRMALRHHPDRVATLGDDVRKAAEKKFQKINDAKERIFKARGM